MSEEIEKNISNILDSIKRALEFEMDGKVLEMIRAMLSANRTFVYGVGRSGLVGQAFAMRLVQIGLKAHFIGEVTTPIVTTKDVVILISNTGETMSAIQTGNIARRQGASVISITSNPSSKLAHVGTISIYLNLNAEKSDGAIPLGTIFEDASMIFLDGIVSCLMLEKGETDASMRGRHAIWV